MPRQNIDYSKTIIYKIVCKDVNITDCYVGSTTDFVRRKNAHKYHVVNNTNKSHYYVYEFIRQNEDWDNWDMIEVEKYNASDHNDALNRERYWIEELKATLNKVRPIITKDEKQEYNTEQNKQYNVEHKGKIHDRKKKYYAENKEKIIELKKEYYEINKEKINETRQANILCECGCLVNKSSILRHKRSQKHVEIMKTLL